MKDAPIPIPRAHPAPAGPTPATPPESLEDFYAPPVGEHITIRFDDAHPKRFEVTEHLPDGVLRLRISDPPPQGKRWNLMALPVNAGVLWGRLVLRVRGRTGVALKVAPVGFLEAPETTEGESDG